MTDDLQIDAPSDRVRVVTLNRPQARNALTLKMHAELDAVLQRFAIDDQVRAVVITGAGDRAFCAGYDIHEMKQWPASVLADAQLQRERWMWSMASYPKPLIGAINGAAHGGGAIIATVLDIRIGCAASEFRFTAGAYGYANNSWQLAPIVGLAKAKEYLYTARRVDSGEACRSGLLNTCVDELSPLAHAIAVASEIAENPGAGVQATKRLLHDAIGSSYQDAYERENALMHGALRPGAPAEIFKRFPAKSAGANESGEST